MIRVFLASLLVWLGIATAQSGSFELRVADALKHAALLADNAQVRIMELTPVRGAVETIEIAQFDSRTGYFDAIIGYGQNRKKISGRATVSIPVVVARATLKRDHTITRGDLELRHVSAAQVPATAFSALDDLEGMAVRRSLPAGRPIREEDIGAPIVLKKNATIEIIYKTAGLELQSSGRSLEEGAIGDTVRVVTDGGDVVVSGEVAGSSRVIVR